MHRSYTHPLRCRRHPSLQCTEAIPIHLGVADTRVCNAQKLYPSTQVSPTPEFAMHRSYTHPLIGVADTRVCNAQKLYISTQVSPTPEFVMHRSYTHPLRCRRHPSLQCTEAIPIHLGVADTRVCNAQKLYISTQVSPTPEFVLHRNYTHPLRCRRHPSL